MARILLLILLVQISLVVITFGQITFTREWVTGKRSSPSNLFHRRESCVSFMPTIQFLMEIEEMQRRDCGGSLKLSALKAGGSNQAEVEVRNKLDEPFEPGSFIHKV